ncbi:glycerate kinase [Leucobacter sp. CSA2]|uniref:Glycerate kinase n=1 Tax=Leucobacter edaphi TaxID=2796472 RepID=A0A934QBU7_9MICO|nr:glycerate kinase [Leucobacter edaphi]MBK0421800.1 glycerate kinase [Leucobacter edaphi]
MSPGPVIVVAPDSLKGSCSAPEAARAIAAGARSVLGPGARVIELPLADGGEGTLDALIAARGGRIVGVPTTDALGRERTGRIGFVPTAGDADSAGAETAVIEAAEANGLPHVEDQPLRALDADSAGVGVLVAAALDAGAREILLCIGGSATSDGGAGVLRALGARLLDAEGEPVGPGARGLAGLASVDLSGVHPAASAARWRIACDVENPLVGPRGAAEVFAPQKGATPEEIPLIDEGLRRLAGALGLPDSAAIERAGLGAAGGLALAPVALWGAELVPGAELVAEAAGLDVAVASADLVVTGEGRLDAQSLDGKVVSRVLGAAAQSPVATVIVLAGEVSLGADGCRAAGITAAASIARGPATLTELRERAPALLEDAAAQLVSVWTAGRSRAC